MGHVKIERTFDIEYYLERRRYGTPSNPRWFVWLLWRRIGANPQKQWVTFGDPWQKVTPNKKELAAALAQIRFEYLITPGGLSGTAAPGTLIKLNTGADARVIDKTSTELVVVLLLDERGKEYRIPPSAVAYVI